VLLANGQVFGANFNTSRPLSCFFWPIPAFSKRWTAYSSIDCDGAIVSTVTTLGVLVVMVVVFISLSRVLLRVIERRARLEGTLSTRGG